MAGRQDPFARIPHTLLEDERLSWKAKGICAYLCGKPDGWKMRVTDLVRNGTDGKAAIRAALNELREFGYAEYIQPRAVKGVFSEGVWKISDTAIFRRESPRTDFRDTDKPDADNRHLSKKEVSKKHLSKNQSKESEETSPVGDAAVSEYSAVWKPISESKKVLLRRIQPPSNYPSEREFNDFIEDECFDHIAMGKRGDLYSDLCNNKWHHWGARRWIPIRDWRAYVRALEEKMEAATGGGF